MNYRPSGHNASSEGESPAKPERNPMHIVIFFVALSVCTALLLMAIPFAIHKTYHAVVGA